MMDRFYAVFRLGTFYKRYVGMVDMVEALSLVVHYPINGGSR